MHPARIDCQDNSDVQSGLPGINTVATKISPATQKAAYFDLSVVRCSETETILSRMGICGIRGFRHGSVEICPHL